MALTKISFQLDRLDKVYHQGESISGFIIVDNKYQLAHNGIMLTMDGLVEINTNLRSINLMDTFTSSNKAIKLVEFAHEIEPPGNLPPGTSRIPFNMLLDGCVDTATLYETYHGVFISILYSLKCRLKRSFFQRDLHESVEFFIEYAPDTADAIEASVSLANSISPNSQPLASSEVFGSNHAGMPSKQAFKFEITPDSLSAPATLSATRRELIPNFKLTGQLDSLIWRLDEPITGEFVIKRCDAVIRSVELQLVRVETCGSISNLATGPNLDSCLTNDELRLPQQRFQRQQFGDLNSSRDSTEVQNIQIGDGDLPRDVPISIHMLLPRLFTCPTLITRHFRIVKFIRGR